MSTQHRGSLRFTFNPAMVDTPHIQPVCFHLDPAHRTQRQARLHVVSFNGTWAGGVLSSRKTVIPEFVKLIADHENVFETPINGVGTDVNLFDRIIGGISGWGTLRNVITALRNIAKHYKTGDRIILNGYSRGAWAARYLAMLIDLIGLPKDGDERLFHRLYKACSNSSIFKKGATERLLDGYDCWTNVKIDALCCFDTVGSLGLPITGIAKPLTILRLWRKKKPDLISDVASNVQFSFHCLSLHETRECYSPTLMRGRNVYQVSFPGCHGDLGWIEETEGLVHAPFAWMIQQVHTHLNISFDEAKLATRFPGYRPPSPPSSATAISLNSLSISASTSATTTTPPQELAARWYLGRIQKLNTGLLALVGKKARKPGLINLPDGATDLKVHIGARLRNDQDNANTVPGYTLMAPVTGKPYWARRMPQLRWGCRSSSNESLKNGSRKSNSWPRIAERIEEAEVGALEARLLGLPNEVVGRS
ncbi:hypothetical protein B0O99DRAFT_691438 [Bisporella sp. PMI_857]|nr:hypothetical protein B0O99DRAFT_691438 [Bisporella sp. PMI_857]